MTPTTDPAGHRERLLRLDRALAATSHWWQPLPFREQCPRWVRETPELVAALRALTPAQVERLEADPSALAGLLGRWIPTLRELQHDGWPVADGVGQAAPRIGDNRDARDVPGRKWQQLQAFGAAVLAGGIDADAPLVEWCAGKGHLGRWLTGHAASPVVSIERDRRLCAEGAALATRGRAGAQRFVPVDVLDPTQAPALSALLDDAHVVALHACGDTHRRLLALAGTRARRIDLAPCCHHKSLELPRTSVEPRARLELTRDDLRLAVTGTMTAAPRERRAERRRREFTLGLIALREAVSPATVARPFRSLPAAWARGPFDEFVRLAAPRIGLDLPARFDVAGFEAEGRARLHEVERLSLVRHGFRRAIESWLVLDLAVALEDAGFECRIEAFCAPSLTPRNLVIRATRIAPSTAGRRQDMRDTRAGSPVAAAGDAVSPAAWDRAAIAASRTSDGPR